MIKVLRLSFIVVLSLLLGCFNDLSSGKYSVLDTDASNYYGGVTVPSVVESPASFDDYAIASNGKLCINGELLTEGPLADISADEVDLSVARSTITGNIEARKISLSKNVRTASRNLVAENSKRSAVNIRSVDSSMSEILDVDKYILKSDGNLYFQKDGVESQAYLSKLPGVWSFDSASATWSVGGDDVEVWMPIICESNMDIKSDNVIFRAPLYVKGTFVASGFKFSVDTAQPFGAAFVVDGDVKIDEAVIVGRTEIGGCLSVSTLLDLIGTIKVNGDIIIDGSVKINYLDTVFKAALVDMNSRFGEDIFLVHSQVFKDVNSKNAVALFSFVKSAKKLTEDSLFRKIDNGSLNSKDYASILQGSTLDLGTTLIQYEGLSSYYSNKLYVLKKLDSEGHPDIEITESLFAAPDMLYHTFVDSVTGETIGTYQIDGNGLIYSDNMALVELSDSSRKAISRAIAQRFTARSVDQDMLDAINSTPAEEVEAKLKEATEAAKAEQIEMFTKAFPDNPISEQEATALIEANESASGEDLRVDEWRSTKSVSTFQKSITAEVEVFEDESLADNSDSMRWSVKKKLKKTVNKIVPKPVRNVCSSIGSFTKNSVSSFCKFVYQHYTERKVIKGVTSGANDDRWTKQYALLNIPGFSKIGPGRCGQISAMMIIRYLGGEKFNDSIMNANIPSTMIDENGEPIIGENGKPKENDNYYSDRYAPTEAETKNISKPLNDMISDSSDNKIKNLASAVNKQLKKYNHSLKAQWRWWLTFGKTDYLGIACATGLISILVQEERCLAAFHEIKNWVNASYPGIMLMNGYYGWNSGYTSHYVPVIGLKHEVFRIFGIPIIGQDKKYVYFHTTWEKGDNKNDNNYFADKRYMRFDWYANPSSRTQFIRIDK